MSNVMAFTATVVRDAEVRHLASGAAVLNVTVANNVGFGDKQKTLFIRCALFGKRAEGSLKDYLKKGQQVFVSGELTQSEYKANDGTTKTSLELNANIVDLVGGKRGESGSQPQPQSQHHEAKSNGYAPNQTVSDVPYDDIPF
jgi:single-strand DNA-binding protein